jgi:hypothetical protein
VFAFFFADVNFTWIAELLRTHVIHGYVLSPFFL